MTTLTDTIKEALLGAVNDPSELEAVLQQHSHSKGPRYIALARATAAPTERLKTVSQKCNESEKQLQEQQEKVKTVDSNQL